MKNDNFKYVINLVMGDPGGDGHDKRDVVVIHCNLDHKQLQEAYDAGTKKVGFDFTNEVCEDYEDTQVHAEHADKLRVAGIDPDVYCDRYDDEYTVYTDQFSAIWLAIAKLGNDDLEYVRAARDNDPSINIGGYGLFT